MSAALPTFAFNGKATIAHLSIRKEGPDDDRELMVDVKLNIISGADLKIGKVVFENGHLLRAALDLTKYAAAPFFRSQQRQRSDDGEITHIQPTTEEWWDGLRELIEALQPQLEAALASPVAEQQAEPVAITNEMVSRFLTWKLPEDFAPDCGVSFDGRPVDAMGYAREWPVGTNLLTAAQARQMLQHVLGASPPQPKSSEQSDEARDAARYRWLREQHAWDGEGEAPGPAAFFVSAGRGRMPEAVQQAMDAAKAALQAEQQSDDAAVPWPYLEQAWRLTLIGSTGCSRSTADRVIAQAMESARVLAAMAKPEPNSPQGDADV